MQKDIKRMLKYCDICQRCKHSHTKYGLLPVKEAELVPWERVCVDLIGPYTVTLEKRQKRKLWAITMIDPATGWFDISEIQTKSADVIANIVEQVWLTRYPQLTFYTMDCRGDLLKKSLKIPC